MEQTNSLVLFYLFKILEILFMNKTVNILWNGKRILKLSRQVPFAQRSRYDVVTALTLPLTLMPQRQALSDMM